MLQIRPRRVVHVIVRARELDAKVGRWDSPGDSEDIETILEMRRGDATERELSAFIRALNEDEKAGLVAVMWIGRGSFEPEELEEAIETAKAEATSPTESYLLGIPLLADYLEEGMEKLGYDVSALEEEFL
ncbi:DUF3775 domain-containing protein [Meinhardsimonia xiamenensis]|nr:DUF3775 domain-containing protein [Meinhardsimonia xiamenensis]